jgi:hypothetical protein
MCFLNAALKRWDSSFAFAWSAARLGRASRGRHSPSGGNGGRSMFALASCGQTIKLTNRRSH